MPSGVVDPGFLTEMQQLASQAKSQAASTRGSATRPWNLPTGSGWSGNPLDISGLSQAFDRDAISASYQELIADGKNPGSVGDVISTKMQGDYNAADERALRARFCTPCRLLAMETARRQGHGQDGGIFTGVVLRFAEDALKAGQD